MSKEEDRKIRHQMKVKIHQTEREYIQKKLDNETQLGLMREQNNHTARKQNQVEHIVCLYGALGKATSEPFIEYLKGELKKMGM